jgi:single-stranded DNA-binding protein
MNSVSLVGRVSDAGVRLSYRESGGPECRWTLVIEEPGKDGAVFRLFCPVVAYGDRSEAFAATLDRGELVAISGKLGWSKPKDPGAKGGVIVVAWLVEKLGVSTTAPEPSSDDGEYRDGSEGAALTLEASRPSPRRKRPNQSKFGAGPSPN